VSDYVLVIASAGRRVLWKWRSAKCLVVFQRVPSDCRARHPPHRAETAEYCKEWIDGSATPRSRLEPPLQHVWDERPKENFVVPATQSNIGLRAAQSMACARTYWAPSGTDLRTGRRLEEAGDSGEISFRRNSANPRQWSFRGGTRGNVVPVVKKLAFPSLKCPMHYDYTFGDCCALKIQLIHIIHPAAFQILKIFSGLRCSEPPLREQTRSSTFGHAHPALGPSIQALARSIVPTL